jgi:hypothetical protein
MILTPPFVGTILNDESLHIVWLIGAIVGFGFTVIITVNESPEHNPSMAEFEGFTL